MKYIKKFETGEWSRGIDLDYVLNHPDANDDESMWIKSLYDEVKIIRKKTQNNDNVFSIIDIKGFDKNLGPYAKVKILGKIFKIWTISFHDDLFLEDFPVTNPERKEGAGFVGNAYQIADLINNIYRVGSVQAYKDVEKYNL